LEILDDSAKHAGHSHGGGGHYTLTLVSEKFEGKSLLDQHRMVQDALRDLFPLEIHALALKTYAPSSWAEIDKVPSIR
jgi:BolA protein